MHSNGNDATGEPPSSSRINDPEGPFGALMPMREWLKVYGPPMFPTWGSLDWFLREHRELLRECPHFLHTSKGRFLGQGFSEWVAGVLRAESDKNLAAAIASRAKRDEERERARIAAERKAKRDARAAARGKR